MTKEHDMLELISEYVRIRNSADSGASSGESLDAIALAFSEALGREKDVAADNSSIPPVVTRSTEERMSYEDVEASHNYMSPNWAD